MGSNRALASTIQSTICAEIGAMVGKSQNTQNFFDDPLVAESIKAISIYLSGNIGLDPNRTISAQAAEARNEGLQWGIEVCRILDEIDPGHCTKALSNERRERFKSKPYDADSLIGRWGLKPEMAQQVYVLFANFFTAFGFVPAIISGYRSPEQQARLREKWEETHTGYPPALDSAHTRGRAIDISTHNLTQDQLFWLARTWKYQDPKNRWGGDFTNPDPNHFDRK